MKDDSAKGTALAKSRRRPLVSQTGLAVLALLIAFATAVVSYMQYRSAEKGIATSHLDSISAMKLSNRPYVSVQASVDPAKFEGRTKVTLRIAANGTSPALDTIVRRRCAVGNGGGHSGQIVPPEDAWLHLSPMAGKADMFPANSIEIHCLTPVVDDDDALFVFAVGDVVYKDIFGDEHQTTFCLETANAPNQSVMLPCTTGNSIK